MRRGALITSMLQTNKICENQLPSHGGDTSWTGGSPVTNNISGAPAGNAEDGSACMRCSSGGLVVGNFTRHVCQNRWPQVDIYEFPFALPMTRNMEWENEAIVICGRTGHGSKGSGGHECAYGICMMQYCCCSFAGEAVHRRPSYEEDNVESRMCVCGADPA